MPMDHDLIEIMMCVCMYKYAMHFPSFFAYLLFPPFLVKQRGAKKRFRVYRIYSKVVPLHFFISLDRWVTGSWVTYGMGQMGHGS